MRPSHALISLAIVFLFAAVPPAAQAQYGYNPPQEYKQLPPSHVNWQSVSRNLTEELSVADVGSLAQRSLHGPMPAEPEAWLRRLALLLRAGYRLPALAMLKSRPQTLSTQKDWGLIGLASEGQKYHDIELVKRVCELFPEQEFESLLINIRSQPTMGGGGRFPAPGPANRAGVLSFDDAWLAKQGMRGNGEWFRYRLRVRSSAGTEQELLAPFEQNVRAHPEEIEPAVKYLQVVGWAGKDRDLSWLATVCKPRLAVQSLFLGMAIAEQRGDPAPFYERSLAIPFTEQENTWYKDAERKGSIAGAGRLLVLTEPDVRLTAKYALMEIYRARDEASKAQKLLEVITALNKDGLPQGIAFQAGQTQAASGARVIEGRIKVAEKQPENAASSEYWLERAEYYAGRKEDKQAVAAYEKALTLAPISREQHPTERSMILFAYEHYLFVRGNGKPDDPMALLHRELDIVPLDSGYARSLIWAMLHHESDSTRLLNPNDQRLWDFLAFQKDWNTLDRLIRQLVINSPMGEREKIWSRAETLAAANPNERAFPLSEALQYMREAKRALPWLEKAANVADKKEQRERISSQLWQAYRGLEDWRSMERLLPRMLEHGNAYGRTETDAMQDLMQTAAKSGDKEAARFFRRWANYDRRVLLDFHPIRGDVLDQALDAYCKSIKKTEPECEIPRDVLRSQKP